MYMHIHILLILVIEDDYTGPKLENGRVTLDFTQQLMTCFKEQKKLHRKYAYKVMDIFCLYSSGLSSLSNPFEFLDFNRCNGSFQGTANFGRN